MSTKKSDKKNFMRACRFGYQDWIERLVSEKRVKSSWVEDGVLIALAEGKTHIIRLLLTQIDSKLINSSYFLSQSVSQNHYECVKLFLSLNQCRDTYAFLRVREDTNPLILPCLLKNKKHLRALCRQKMLYGSDFLLMQLAFEYNIVFDRKCWSKRDFQYSKKNATRIRISHIERDIQHLIIALAPINLPVLLTVEIVNLVCQPFVNLTSAHMLWQICKAVKKIKN